MPKRCCRWWTGSCEAAAVSPAAIEVVAVVGRTRRVHRHPRRACRGPRDRAGHWCAADRRHQLCRGRAALVPSGATGALLVALDSRRDDLYVQLFDAAGDACSEPAAILPRNFASVALTAAPRCWSPAMPRKTAAAALPARAGIEIVPRFGAGRGRRSRRGAARWPRSGRPGRAAALSASARCQLPEGRGAGLEQGDRRASNRSRRRPRRAGAAASRLLSRRSVGRRRDRPDHGACPGAFGWLAWENDAPVGFVLVRDLGAECEILSLGVVPDHRRRGIGSDAAVGGDTAEARRRDARRRWCSKWRSTTIAANALYAALGFVPVGRRQHYYRRPDGRADALILRMA